MKPAEFLAKVRARKTAAPAPQAPAAARVIGVDDDVPLDSKWLAEQEAAEAASARLNALGIGDDEFAQAVWLIQVDEAWRDQHSGSASTRVSRILSHGATSGLSPGQLAALTRLMARIDTARDVLGAAERRRTGARPNVVAGAGGRNF